METFLIQDRFKPVFFFIVSIFLDPSVTDRFTNDSTKHVKSTQMRSREPPSDHVLVQTHNNFNIQ